MTRTAILRPHFAGLFSLINKVITCAELFDDLHVDYHGTIYGPENLWDHFFENHRLRSLPKDPVCHPDDTVQFVTDYPHQRYTAHQAGLLYLAKDQSWRERLNHYWKGFGLRCWMRDEAHNFVQHALPDPFFSVLVRTETHGGEQITGKSQPLGLYFAHCDEQFEGGAHKLFLLANHVETREAFVARYGKDNVVFASASRCSLRRGDVEAHLAEPQTLRDAEDCLREVLVASMGRLLIHPVSNMATAILYINPELDSVYLP
jgi:hypothetical protein